MRAAPLAARCLAASLLLAGLGGLAACKRQDMYAQGYSRTWDRNGFFRDGASMRPPVAGTVARDAPNAPAPQPLAIDAALVQRGHERFGIFCTPCHGRAGNGQGMIVQRGFPHAPSLTQGELRQAKAQRFYDVISNGHGAMYGYGDRISPADRWAVIAYIRALQLSQAANPASLPPEDRTQLDAAR